MLPTADLWIQNASKTQKSECWGKHRNQNFGENIEIRMFGKTQKSECWGKLRNQNVGENLEIRMLGKTEDP